MQKPLTSYGKGHCGKTRFNQILPQAKPKNQDSRSSEQSNKFCQHCGFEFRLNVVSDRRSKTKYLRSGCCDAPLRPCPDPVELLRCSSLSQHERDYLQRVSSQDWFSGQIASVLLQIEGKVQASAEVAR